MRRAALYWEGRSLQQLGPPPHLDLRPQRLPPWRARPLHRRHPRAVPRLWRRPQRAPERPHARGAARILRDRPWRRCSTSAPCAGRPTTACRSTASASRRRSTRRWPAAATCATCCASGSSGWPAASASTTTTSPGRPSAAPMPRMPPGRCRPICGASTSTRSRARADRVEVLNRSITEYLAGCADASRDRYVLLDAQDWMTDAQLNALWRRDHPHRAARRARDLPHRRRAVAAARPGRRRRSSTAGATRRRNRRSSARATARRSMAASTSTSSRDER